MGKLGKGEQFAGELYRKFRKIKRVAVVGAGTMGSQIAAHIANVGIPCDLLELFPPN